MQFLSTPSARRATGGAQAHREGPRDFYPRPPRGGRPAVVYLDGDSLVISIHALREEGDRGVQRGQQQQGDFYPRPPRGGRPVHHGQRSGRQEISIHALREEGDLSVPLCAGCKTTISIHALREEGDLRPAPQPAYRSHFYPRPPRGGRLTRSRGCAQRQQISIHALREEGDAYINGTTSTASYFYPRPPRGGRPESVDATVEAIKFLSTPSARRATLSSLMMKTTVTRFLSTPSARRATLGGVGEQMSMLISIHALREEGDVRGSSHGRFDSISIHALREEGDMLCTQSVYLFHPISIHALREEGDYLRRVRSAAATDFYPRPPRGGRQRPRTSGSSMQKFLSTPSARRATACRRYCRCPGGISIHALREEGDSKNGEKHLRFCFIIKRSAQIWKSLSKNIRKNSCDLHRTA